MSKVFLTSYMDFPQPLHLLHLPGGHPQRRAPPQLHASDPVHPGHVRLDLQGEINSLHRSPGSVNIPGPSGLSGNRGINSPPVSTKSLPTDAPTGNNQGSTSFIYSPPGIDPAQIARVKTRQPSFLTGATRARTFSSSGTSGSSLTSATGLQRKALRPSFKTRPRSRSPRRSYSHREEARQWEIRADPNGKYMQDGQFYRDLSRSAKKGGSPFYSDVDPKFLKKKYQKLVTGHKSRDLKTWSGVRSLLGEWSKGLAKTAFNVVVFTLIAAPLSVTQEHLFLRQRLSVAVQIGNAACVRESCGDSF